jgi:DNA invertase Pin-like site-specific DNA recombinase
MARTTAIIYIRKSLVIKGGASPASPEMQEQACLRVAQSLNLRAEVYTDAEGHWSGKTEDRPQWTRLRARLKAPDVAALIVYNWSRAVRNVKLLLALVDELDHADIRFIATDNQIDTGSASGRFALTVIAAADEYESNVSSERRISTIDYLRRHKGRHYGLAPFGTRRELRDGERVLVPDTRPQPNGTDHEALMEVYTRWVTTRSSYERTTISLNADGWHFRNRHGALREFTPDDVKRCLHSHWILAGYVTVGRAYRGHYEIIPGSHAPILPDSLTAAVGARLADHKKHGQRHGRPRLYPLAGLVHCEACGARLVGFAPATARRYNHRIRCQHGQPRSYRADMLETAAREHMAALSVPADYLERSADDVMRWLQAEQGGGRELGERAKIELSLSRLTELYTDGVIDRAEYNEKRAFYLAKMPPASADVPSVAGVELYGLPEFSELARHCEPQILRDLAWALYEKITVDAVGGLTYHARQWCKGWA